jgi:hypothetical protein
MAIMLSDINVSGNQSRVLPELLTAVGPAFIRASLILVGDVGTTVLIQVSCIEVPARVAAQTYVPAQTTSTLSTGHAWHELRWPATLCSRAEVALLLCVCKDSQSRQHE